ncbi:hypothetical protein BC831DRAFT_468629 [Entophlyctis helioformis]|nr:hypothetical protein BC831DRAFT_468629 [Entophlyctis helioformis]
MAPIGKIYTYPNNPRVHKALIAAKYNGVDVEEVHIQMGVDNKTPDFLAKFPLGKVPAFEGADKTYIYESNAIAHYVAASKDGSKLLGKDRKESAYIQQFLALADNEFGPAQAAWIFPILGFFPPNEVATKKAQEDVKRTLAALDKHLLTRTFLAAEHVTLADIVLALSLVNFYKLVLDPAFRAPYKNVTRWFTTCVNQPHFKAVLGTVELCEKAKVAEVKAAAPVAAPAPAAKAAAPAAAKPAAAAVEKPKKKKDDDEEEEESFADEKPKGKNPLDLLPKSSLVMDDWKRFYSNNETRPTACDWFWKNFDPQGYSLWRVDYKYNDELALTFMSSNLIGGFFQRLESARKYAFGSLVILGEDNNNQITGFFMFRGNEVPFEVTDCPDYPSYTFTRASHENAKDKADFEAIIAWDDVIYGKKFADGKIFK